MNIQTPRDKANAILIEVARDNMLPARDIISKSRRRPLVQARWDVMARLKNEMGWNGTKIGSFFGLSRKAVCYAMKQLDASHAITDKEECNGSF